MVRSASKSKISIEPAKHITVIKLLHQTEKARERNTENRTRRLKIKSNGVIVSQNYPITDYYKFLHDKNNHSDHNYRFLHVSHPCNYGLIALHSLQPIRFK